MIYHRRQNDIPNSGLQFYHPISKNNQFKITGWENHLTRVISSPHNADAITFMHHAISSFFVKHERLKFQLFLVPLPHPKLIQNQYCHVKLNTLQRLAMSIITHDSLI